MTTNETNETKRESNQVDVAREELRTVDPQLMKAVQHSLREFQKALEPLKEWRASSLWETAEQALDLLAQGEFDAWSYHTKPSGFVHWKEKYVTDKDALPF